MGYPFITGIIIGYAVGAITALFVLSLARAAGDADERAGYK